MTVMHSGRRPHFARIHVDLRQFFSLAARLASDGRLRVDTTWMRELSELVVEDNHSSSNRSLWRRTPAGRLVCRVEGVQKDIPPRPFSFVCVLPFLLWPLILLLANLLIFFLPKSKSSSSRSSVLRACRSIFTKQTVPVVTRDGPVHYNVCTYFGMPIKLFLIRIWSRPPPPFSSGIRI